MEKANEIFERSHQDEEGREAGKKEQNTRETVNRTTNECGKEEHASTVCIGRKEVSKGSRIGQKLHLSGSAGILLGTKLGKREYTTNRK